MQSIAVRWTIGDVAERGFAALRYSIWGAYRLFGADAHYVVCHNSVARDLLVARLGELPGAVRFVESGSRSLPAALRGHVDGRMAEGVAWKLLPLRLFPDLHELALDNDCILWAMPPALRAWSRAPDGVLLAEDVCRGFGVFDALCGPRPLNSGIRGLPPEFDLDDALGRVLARRPARLQSELDEQGLQAAALYATGKLEVVGLADVSVCSPFPPHLPELGQCGAHFVGLNTRRYGWRYGDTPAEVVRAAHWDALAPEVERLVGAPPSRTALRLRAG